MFCVCSTVCSTIIDHTHNKSTSVIFFLNEALLIEEANIRSRLYYNFGIIVGVLIMLGWCCHHLLAMPPMRWMEGGEVDGGCVFLQG